MNQGLNFARRQAAPGGRAKCRPQRLALRVECLHKALRQPSAGPITAPADVVYECLTLLRRPDLESLAPFLPATSFDPSLRRVALPVGGELVEEAGPLACCHTIMDTAARRVLPGHLLRRCRVLSSWQLGDTCQQRVALTACTGEEAVFVWRLRRAPGGGDAEHGAMDGPSSWGGASGGSSAANRTTSSSGREGGSGRSTSTSTTSTTAADGASGCATAGGRTAMDGDADGGFVAPELVSAPGSGSGSGMGSGPAAPEVMFDGEAVLGRVAASAPSSTAASPSGSPPTHGSPWSSPRGPSHLAPPTTAAPSASGSGSGSDFEPEFDPVATAAQRGGPSGPTATAWIVESIRRDDSYDEEELPPPAGPSSGPSSGGGGTHPRCSPELVVKAQLAALRHGDVVGAASYNLWSRSTSGGWDLHLSAFRSLLRQHPYTALLSAAGAELGPSALASPRRMVQEVRLLGPHRSAGSGSGLGSGAGVGCSTFVYQLGMQANGCWVVEAIRAVA